MHGPIVARDELGQPKDPSSVRSSKKPSIPDWQEPALLAEIKVIEIIQQHITYGDFHILN
jgi:hypothetical protein